MIIQALYKDNEGCGLIADSLDELRKQCTDENANVRIGATELIPGETTNLEGFFNRDVEYLGRDKCDGALVFYIGTDGEKFFSKTIYWISESRFYIQYKFNGGRDYNLVNGVWDFLRVGKKKMNVIKEWPYENNN